MIRLKNIKMKKIVFALIVFASVVNVFAQPTFEKLYSNSEAISPLSGDFFAVKQNGKWGVMKNSTQILDFYYDSIDILSDGIITFIKNNQAGFADTIGNVITLATYPLETPYNRADESLLNVYQSGSALVYNGANLVLLSKEGKQINDSDVEIVSKADNCVVFKSKGAYGIMDAQGNVLAQNKYRQIQTIIAGELYAYTSQKNGMDYIGLIDAKGEVKSPAQYNDMIIINSNDKFYIKAFTETGKQSLFDAKGNQLFSPLYQNIEPLNSDKYYIFTDNSRKGVISSDYKECIPAAYDDIKMATINKDTLFLAKNDNTIYILTNDNKPIDILNGNIKDFVSYKKNSGELIYIADSMLNYGIRSSKKGWLIEPQYLDVFAQSKGAFIVRKKDKWGAVDINNNEVIPFEYEKVRASKAKTCIVFYEGKKKSIVLLDNGKKMEFPKTDNVLPMANYVEYKVKKERVRLYFDGNELKDKFTLIGSNRNGVLVAKTKKGWSYYNSNTYDQLTEQYFDYATSFENGAAYVVKNKKLLQIDTDYNISATILDDNYKNLTNTAALLAMSSKMNKNFIIVEDKQGKKTLVKINR